MIFQQNRVNFFTSVMWRIIWNVSVTTYFVTTWKVNKCSHKSISSIALCQYNQQECLLFNTNDLIASMFYKENILLFGISAPWLMVIRACHHEDIFSEILALLPFYVLKTTPFWGENFLFSNLSLDHKSWADNRCGSVEVDNQSIKSRQTWSHIRLSIV